MRAMRALGMVTVFLLQHFLCDEEKAFDEISVYMEEV